LIALFFFFFPEQSEQPILVFLNQAKANELKRSFKCEGKTLEIPLILILKFPNTKHLSTTMKISLAFHLCGFFSEQSEQPILTYLNQAKANDPKKDANMKAKLRKTPNCRFHNLRLVYTPVNINEIIFGISCAVKLVD
jgi:hypothetical protein